MPFPLFTYGTLRPHNDNRMSHWLARNADHHGPACVTGTLYLIDDYPGLVLAGQDAVQGDLYWLHSHDAGLAMLDDYEECTPHHPAPHEYRRARITVRAQGCDVEAWTYLYARPVARHARIPSGDFHDLTCTRPVID